VSENDDAQDGVNEPPPAAPAKRRPTGWRSKLANEDLAVWAVGLVIAGAIVVWFVR